ncbi:MAG: branched-chain amino acid ABC transporter permease [Gammaproteobacteria bacterium]|nr:branched-chain amino acid ABC transporter permease [Gammaproteobacteria bacterium]MCP4880344.1 branched-chain amino acid ABC transporter permease [Gammaproteobacteria bacterium]
MNFDHIDIIQSLIDGVLFGSIYALIGLGFTLIFGAMHKLNLAYAASGIAGAYAGLMSLTILGLPALMAFFIGPITAGIIGLLLYFACFRFMPRGNHLAPLMASIGALFFIDEVIIHETSGSPLSFPAVLPDAYFFLGEFGIRGDLLIVMGFSFILMAIVMLLLYRTKLGLGTRATSQQPVAALLCGIPTHRTNGTTFVLAGVLGGFAGCLLAASVGVLSPLLTLPLTIKGLIVTVIGGLGSIRGAIIAGFAVGAAEGLFLLVRGVNERDIYVFLLLFLFLVFRPNGLFGTTINRD